MKTALSIGCALLAVVAGPQDPPAPETVAFFHENGVKAREGRIVHGRREGVWKGWYDNGAAQYEGAFHDYERVGHWVYFENTGKKKMEGDWREGKKQGTWTY